MGTEEDVYIQGDRPPSPYLVLQQISEEAVRVAGEALQGVYSRSNSTSHSVPPRHRRCQSEVVAGPHGHSNSFQRFKSQMQRAWRWGGFSKEEGERCSFNPEVLANQKRQWYQLHSKTMVFHLNMFSSVLSFFFYNKFLVGYFITVFYWFEKLLKVRCAIWYW